MENTNFILVAAEPSRSGSGYICRCLAQNQIKYIEVENGTILNDDWRSLINGLSTFSFLDFPTSRWNFGKLGKDLSTGRFMILDAQFQQLPEIEDIWHPMEIDVSELTGQDSQLESDPFDMPKVQLMEHPLFDVPVILKRAWVPDQIDNFIAEGLAYKLLDGKGMTPKFLGHVIEDGRVIGFLLEHIENFRFPDVPDIPACNEALKRLRKAGISHGDAHRENFLIKDGTVYLIDFEYAKFEVDVDSETEKEDRDTL